MIERRIRRSNQRGAALTHQLQASVERLGARFMVLADADGLVLATSESGQSECEEAAARLACLRLCDESSGEVWSAGRAIAGLSFVALGQRLILGIGGSNVDGALPEVRRAIDGAKRILS